MHTEQGSLKVTDQVVLWMNCKLLFLHSADTFTYIVILLRFFAVFSLPQPRVKVLSAPSNTSNRTFCSTITEDRLNGLAQMYINKDIKPDYENVMTFHQVHHRRLRFVELITAVC